MNTIENLYLSNIDVGERPFPPNVRYVKVKNKVTEIKERFLKELSPEAEELLEDYTDACYELLSVIEADIFSIGFRLGVKLITDVYTIDDGVILEKNRL